MSEETAEASSAIRFLADALDQVTRFEKSKLEQLKNFAWAEENFVAQRLLALSRTHELLVARHEELSSSVSESPAVSLRPLKAALDAARNRARLLEAEHAALVSSVISAADSDDQSTVDALRAHLCGALAAKDALEKNLGAANDDLIAGRCEQERLARRISQLEHQLDAAKAAAERASSCTASHEEVPSPTFPAAGTPPELEDALLRASRSDEELQHTLRMLRDAKAENEGLRGDLAGLRAEAEARARQAGANADSAKRASDEAAASHAAMWSQLHAANEDNARLTERCRDLTAALDQQSADDFETIRRLTSQNEALERAKNAWAVEKASISKMNHSLRDDLERCGKSLAVAQAQLEAANRKIESLSAECEGQQRALSAESLRNSAEIAGLSSDRDSLTARLLEATNTANALQSQLDSERAAAAARDAENEDLIAQLRRDLHGTKEKLLDCDANVASFGRKGEQLSSDLGNARAEISRLRDERKRAEATASQRDNDLRSLKASLETALEELAECREKCKRQASAASGSESELAQTIKKLRDEAADQDKSHEATLRDLRKEHENEISNLLAELKTAKGAASRLQAVVDDLNGELSNARARDASAQSGQQRSTDRIVELERDLAAARDELLAALPSAARHSAELESLRADLAQVTADKERANNARTELSEELLASRKGIESAQEALVALNRQTESQMAKMEASRRQALAAKSAEVVRAAGLEADVNSLTAQLAELRSKTVPEPDVGVRLREENVRLGQLLAGQRGVVQGLEDQVADLEELVETQKTQHVHATNDLKERLSMQADTIADLKGTIAELRDSGDDNCRRHADALSEAVSALQAARMETARWRGAVDNLTESLNRCHVTIDELTAEKDGLKERLTAHATSPRVPERQVVTRVAPAADEVPQLEAFERALRASIEDAEGISRRSAGREKENIRLASLVSALTLERDDCLGQLDQLKEDVENLLKELADAKSMRIADQDDAAARIASIRDAHEEEIRKLNLSAQAAVAASVPTNLSSPRQKAPTVDTVASLQTELGSERAAHAATKKALDELNISHVARSGSQIGEALTAAAAQKRAQLEMTSRLEADYEQKFKQAEEDSAREVAELRDSLGKRIATLERQLAAAESQRDTAARSQSRLEEDAAAATATASARENDANATIRALRAQLSACDEKATAASNESIRLNTELNCANVAREKLSDRCRLLEVDMKRAQRDLAAAEVALEAARAAAQDSEERLSGMLEQKKTERGLITAASGAALASITAQREEKDQLLATVGDLEALLAAAEASRDALKKQITDIETDRDQIANMLSATRSKESLLEMQVDDLQAKVSKAEGQFTSALQKMSSTNDDNVAFRHEISSLQGALHSKNADIGRLGTALTAAQGDIERLARALQELKGQTEVEIGRVTRVTNGGDGTVDVLRARSEELMSRLNDAESAVADMRAAMEANLGRSRGESMSLRAELNAFQATAALTEQDRLRLLEDQEAANNVLTEELNRLRELEAGLRADNARLRAENSSQSHALALASVQRNPAPLLITETPAPAATSAMDGMRNLVESLRAEVESLRSEREELLDRAALLQEQNVHLSADKSAVAEELQQTVHQYETMRSSLHTAQDKLSNEIYNVTTLKKELDDLLSSYREVQSQRDDGIVRLTVAKDSISALESRIDQLEAILKETQQAHEKALAALREDVAAAHEAEAASSAALASLQDTLSSQESINEGTRKDLQVELQRRLASEMELQRALTKAELDLDHALHDRQHAISELEAVQRRAVSESDKLQRKIQETTNALRASENSIKQLRQSYSQEVAMLKDSLQSQAGDISALRRELLDGERARLSAESNLEEARRGLAALRIEYDSLHSTHNSARVELEALRDQFANAQDDTERRRKEVHRIDLLRKEAVTELAALRQEVPVAERSVQELRARCETLDSALRTAKSTAATDIARLRDAEAGYKQKIEALQMQVRDQKGALAAMDTEFNAVTRASSAAAESAECVAHSLRAELAGVTERNNDLVAELEVLRSSASKESLEYADRVNYVTAQLAKSEEVINELKSDVSSLETAVANAMALANGYQQRVADLEESQFESARVREQLSAAELFYREKVDAIDSELKSVTTARDQAVSEVDYVKRALNHQENQSVAQALEIDRLNKLVITLEKDLSASEDNLTNKNNSLRNQNGLLTEALDVARAEMDRLSSELNERISSSEGESAATAIRKDLQSRLAFAEAQSKKFEEALEEALREASLSDVSRSQQSATFAKSAAANSAELSKLRSAEIMLKQLLSTADAENASFRSKIDSLEERVASLLKQNQSITQAKAVIDREKVELQELFSSLQMQFTSTIEQLEEAQRAQSEKSIEIAEWNARCSKLVASVERLTDEKTELHTMLQELTDTKSAVSTALTSTRTEGVHLLSEVNALKLQVSDLKSRLMESEAVNVELAANHSANRQRLATMAETLASKTQNATDLSLKVESLQAEVTVLREERDRYVDQLGEVVSPRSPRPRVNLLPIEDEVADLAATVGTLRSALQTVTADYAEATTKAQREEARVIQLSATVSAMEREMESLKSSLRDTKDTAADREQTLRNMYTQSERYRAEEDRALQRMRDQVRYLNELHDHNLLVLQQLQQFGGEKTEKMAEELRIAQEKVAESESALISASEAHDQELLAVQQSLHSAQEAERRLQETVADLMRRVTDSARRGESFQRQCHELDDTLNYARARISGLEEVAKEASRERSEALSEADTLRHALERERWKSPICEREHGPINVVCPVLSEASRVSSLVINHTDRPVSPRSSRAPVTSPPVRLSSRPSTIFSSPHSSTKISRRSPSMVHMRTPASALPVAETVRIRVVKNNVPPSAP